MKHQFMYSAPWTIIIIYNRNQNLCIDRFSKWHVQFFWAYYSCSQATELTHSNWKFVLFCQLAGFDASTWANIWKCESVCLIERMLIVMEVDRWCWLSFGRLDIDNYTYIYNNIIIYTISIITLNWSPFVVYLNLKQLSRRQVETNLDSTRKEQRCNQYIDPKYIYIIKHNLTNHPITILAMTSLNLSPK